MLLLLVELEEWEMWSETPILGFRAPHLGELPPHGAAGLGAPAARQQPLPPKGWQK